MTRLEEVAKKFGNVPKELRRKDQIVPQYLTEEEFSLLPQCPRTGSIQSAGTWVKIGGRQTYPLSGALTSDEKQEYYKFKYGNSGTRTPRSTSAAVTGATQEEIQKYQECLEELLKLKPSKKLMEYFAAIRPKTAEEIQLRTTLEAQGFSPEQIEMVVQMQQKNLAEAAKNEQATA